MVHNPNQIPELAAHYFYVPINSFTSVTVSPLVINTQSAVMGYHPEKRQCYLNFDRNLKYFKIYNQPNCIFECLTHYVLNKCGCVEFNMPRNNYSRNKQTC